MTETFHLCDLLEEEEDGDQFVKWIKVGWSTIASIDYPDEAAIFGAKPLPPYPIGEMCKYLNDPGLMPKKLLAQVYRGLSVFYNLTGDVKCNKIEYESDDDVNDDVNAWEYQVI